MKGFWEKFYFRPGNMGYPVFETAVGKVGVYICYDRHFPEGARALGLNGAEMVFIPSATSRGLSEYLWRIEQVSHAVANGYFVGRSTGSASRSTSVLRLLRPATSSIRAPLSAREGSPSTRLIIRDMAPCSAFARQAVLPDRRPDEYDDLVRLASRAPCPSRWDPDSTGRP